MSNTTSTAQIQDYLKNVEYPCTKRELVDAATSEGASAEILSLIEQFPEGEYNSPLDVGMAIDKIE